MSNKIAVISDIHGNILALEKVASDISNRQVNLVINLGDHLSGPLWPKETVDFLKKQNWIQILGNHDRQLITQKQENMGASDLYASQFLNTDDLNWLKSLPERRKPFEGFLIFHGSPDNNILYLLETIESGRVRLASQDEVRDRLGQTKSPMILCGHTHIPRIFKLIDGPLIVNPGSIGLPAYDDIKPEPHVMETGSPHARYAILEEKNKKWSIELIALSYDHNKAAKRARENDRADWEIGLQTGFMKI